MSVAQVPGLLYGAHVRANGIRQHYLRFGGAGPAIIIVPGISTAAAQWAFIAERLCIGHDVYVLASGGAAFPKADRISIIRWMPAPPIWSRSPRRWK